MRNLMFVPIARNRGQSLAEYGMIVAAVSAVLIIVQPILTTGLFGLGRRHLAEFEPLVAPTGPQTVMTFVGNSTENATWNPGLAMTRDVSSNFTTADSLELNP